MKFVPGWRHSNLLYVINNDLCVIIVLQNRPMIVHPCENLLEKGPISTIMHCSLPLSVDDEQD